MGIYKNTQIIIVEKNISMKLEYVIIGLCIDIKGFFLYSNYILGENFIVKRKG